MLKNNAVIDIDHLSIGYANRELLANVSLEIKSGEFIGILGQNGSGKSTFLKALLGLLKPLSGSISILGQTPQQGNTNIGYMPQLRTIGSLANLTSRALLEMTSNGTKYGFPVTPRDKKMEIEKWLHMVDAESYADRPFQQLSGGERQRIYLAQALLGHPSILLLDEPLSNLDPKYQDTFISLLHDIQQRLDVTILLTAHDPNPLLTVMTRVLYIAKQKAVIGTVHEVITSDVLTHLYETPIEVINIKNRLFVLGENASILSQDNHHHD